QRAGDFTVEGVGPPAERRVCTVLVVRTYPAVEHGDGDTDTGDLSNVEVRDTDANRIPVGLQLHADLEGHVLCEGDSLPATEAVLRQQVCGVREVSPGHSPVDLIESLARILSVVDRIDDGH